MASPTTTESLRPVHGGRAIPALAVVLALGLGGCSLVEVPLGAAAAEPNASPAAAGSPSPAPTTVPTASTAVVLVSPGDPDLPVSPDQPIAVQAVDGRLTNVAVTTSDGSPLAGALSADASRWSSSPELLSFGARYAVTAEAIDEEGRVTRTSTTVRVATPDLVSASMNVSDGAVVGIGMPLVVRLSSSVKDRAAVERRLAVDATPSVQGAWSWMSDREVQFRPATYWQPGTRIRVRADLEGTRLGDQLWGSGAMDRSLSIGSANIYRVDVAAHTMEVVVGGVVRGTIPITTGKPGFLTRNGVKVIMSKERSRRMRSETVGIARNSNEGYDLTVDYAMRLTNSGEFIHAAPWSVSQQGRANVSHGCTGMSTANAEWLYRLSKPGDVVEYVNSPRPMTATNGYGVWNVSWDRWRNGSALVAS